MTEIIIQYPAFGEVEITYPEFADVIVEVGSSVFVPPSSGSSIQFVVSSPITPWVWNHNLGYYPLITVHNPAGEEVDVAVQHVSVNTVSVQFAVPAIGRIVAR